MDYSHRECSAYFGSHEGHLHIQDDYKQKNVQSISVSEPKYFITKPVKEKGKVNKKQLWDFGSVLLEDYNDPKSSDFWMPNYHTGIKHISDPNRICQQVKGSSSQCIFSWQPKCSLERIPPVKIDLEVQLMYKLFELKVLTLC